MALDFYRNAGYQKSINLCLHNNKYSENIFHQCDEINQIISQHFFNK